MKLGQNSNFDKFLIMILNGIFGIHHRYFSVILIKGNLFPFLIGLFFLWLIILLCCIIFVSFVNYCFFLIFVIIIRFLLFLFTLLSFHLILNSISIFSLWKKNFLLNFLCLYQCFLCSKNTLLNFHFLNIIFLRNFKVDFWSRFI